MSMDGEEAMKKKDDDASMEEGAFAGVEVPKWRDQITVRGLVVSFAMGFLFCLIIQKLLLTTGIIPGFNMAAGLIGFFLVKTWNKLLEKPKWRDQITVRGLVVSFAMGFLFCLIIQKLLLTTGIIPGFNMAAGLIGFFLVKTWNKLLEKVGVVTKPFTRQENTVIQTGVIACCGIAASGGLVYSTPPTYMWPLVSAIPWLRCGNVTSDRTFIFINIF
ncbi:hypothetical protein AMTR_s00154p00064240 [Amborella trichopoda]|uniref:Uncharacterized protein n=1 Tax=Amborella trichopoda TaxID=13333 RepID=W1PIT3_AMBTC|nr:hypothetical protein AMTR_s00154p00064240 [Amborella trichopoda]